MRFMVIRGEVRCDPDGHLRMVVYAEEELEAMARVMVGKEVIHKGKLIGKVIRAEMVDGKILWEAEPINRNL